MAETGRFYKAGSKYEKAYHKTKSKDFQALAAIKAGKSKCKSAERSLQLVEKSRKSQSANA